VTVEPFHVLVVCTANICRSVMAEAYLSREIARRGLPVTVSSAGLLFEGRPPSDDVIAVLAESGLDVSAHRSQVVTPAMVETADLVVTMERRHVREVTRLVDGVTDRTHTLAGLVSRLAEDPRDPEAGPAERIAACAARRTPSDLLGGGADEIADPHGRSRRVHRRTAADIEEHCTALLDALFDS
jgi:protein-tyrosine phosphatase